MIQVILSAAQRSRRIPLSFCEAPQQIFTAIRRDPSATLGMTAARARA